jgi:hypothetical protein
LPAEQVRPSGPGAPTQRPSAPAPTRWSTSDSGRAAVTGAWPTGAWPTGPAATRPAATRAADTQSPGTSSAFRTRNKWGLAAAGGQSIGSPLPSRAVVRVLVGLIAFAIVVALALWANSNRPLTAAGSGTDASKITVGQCLSATSQRIVGQVDCSSAAADFAVVGVSPKSSAASDCSASPSDVVVVASGPTVLCLDYVAAVGQCLFAGDQTTGVGKVDCSTADPGVLRVLAVLPNSINPAACPAGTRQSLVHRYNSQVICLGSH